MLQIDRMEIDDVGGNPTRLAAAIIEQLPISSGSVPVRQIAESLDIYEIREEPLRNLEGVLIAPDDKSEGVILVHSERPETRKRFTIGHELGHYVNPWHRSENPEGFRCSARDMALEHYDPTDRRAKMEAEANEFAAELLMPQTWVANFLRSKRGTDLTHILEMAKRFEVSKEAAARRYVAKVNEALAVIFSKDGVIGYVKATVGFPRLSVWNGDPLPETCLSKQSKIDIGKTTEWQEVSGHLWLVRSANMAVCEQTLAQQNGFRMSLLSVENDEPEDEDEEDWELPRFS